MTDSRPILQTLALLFVAVAGGQLFSMFSVTDAKAARPDRMAAAMAVVAEGDEAYVAGETNDGITIVDDRASGEPVEDWDTKLRAERYALKKERDRLEAEKQVLAQNRERLSEDQTAQHRHLSQMYAKMPAGKAAAVLVKLKPAEAATFISLMPGDAGAEILASMPADAAVAITREVLARTTTK